MFFKWKKKREEAKQLREYSNKLDVALYEILADISEFNGSGGAARGMALTAMLVAAELYNKIGIEGDAFLIEAKRIMEAVEKYSKTKDPDSDKPIDNAIERRYKSA